MSLIGDYGYPVIDADGYSGLLQDAGVFQDAMEMLQVRLAQDFLNVWATIPGGADPVYIRRYLTETLADIQLVYGSDAVSIAAEFLNMTRAGAELPVVLASAANAEQVSAAVGWSMSKPETQTLLWGAMQRMMNNAYRKTIQDSAYAAGNGFARVPDGNACPFCLMLASRGAVYYTEREAREIGLRTRTGKSFTGKTSRDDRVRRQLTKGLKQADYGYHENCNCTVIEVTEKTGLTEANIFLDRLWGETFYEDPVVRTKLKEGATPSLKQWEEALSGADLPWLSAKQFMR